MALYKFREISVASRHWDRQSVQLPSPFYLLRQKLLLELGHLCAEEFFHTLFRCGRKKAVADTVEYNLVDGCDIVVEGVVQELHIAIEGCVEEWRIVRVDGE